MKNGKLMQGLLVAPGAGNKVLLCIFVLMSCFIINGNQAIAQAEKDDNCTSDVCLAFENQYLLLQYTGGHSKRVELSSPVTKIIKGSARFFVLTRTHVYVLSHKGDLVGKILLSFTPVSVVANSGGLILSQDDDLRYQLTEADGQLKLMAVVGKLGGQEYFIARQEDGMLVYFYKDRIVYPDNSVGKIVLLNHDTEQVIYVDENLDIIQRDADFIITDQVVFPYATLIDFPGFAAILSLLKHKEVERFLRTVSNESLQDKLLAKYIDLFFDAKDIKGARGAFFIRFLSDNKRASSERIFVSRFEELAATRLDHSEVKQFLASVNNPALQDKLLAKYIGLFFDDQHIKGERTEFFIRFLSENDRAISQQLFNVRFQKLSEENRQHCLAGIDETMFREKLMYQYALTVNPDSNISRFTYLFDNLPADISIAKDILNHILSNLSGLSNEKKSLITNKIVEHNLLAAIPEYRDPLITAYIKYNLVASRINATVLRVVDSALGRNELKKSSAALVESFLQLDEEHKKYCLQHISNSRLRNNLVAAHEAQKADRERARKQQEFNRMVMGGFAVGVVGGLAWLNENIPASSSGSSSSYQPSYSSDSDSDIMSRVTVECEQDGKDRDCKIECNDVNILGHIKVTWDHNSQRWYNFPSYYDTLRELLIDHKKIPNHLLKCL